MDEMDGKRIVKRSSLVDAPRVLTLVIKRFSGGHFGKAGPRALSALSALSPFLSSPARLLSSGAGPRRIAPPLPPLRLAVSSHLPQVSKPVTFDEELDLGLALLSRPASASLPPPSPLPRPPP